MVTLVKNSDAFSTRTWLRLWMGQNIWYSQYFANTKSSSYYIVDSSVGWLLLALTFCFWRVSMTPAGRWLFLKSIFSIDSHLKRAACSYKKSIFVTLPFRWKRGKILRTTFCKKMFLAVAAVCLFLKNENRRMIIIKWHFQTYFSRFPSPMYCKLAFKKQQHMTSKLQKCFVC